MNALEFAKANISEIQDRLAEIGERGHEISDNFKKTPEQVVEKFFDDQGHKFEKYDIAEILSLVKGGIKNG